VRQYIYFPLFIAAFLLSLAALAYPLQRPFYVALPLATGAGVLAVKLTMRREEAPPRKRVPYLLARRQAQQEAVKLDAGNPHPRPLEWGGLELPTEYRSKGFFFMGEQGSGKSLSFYLLMKPAIIDDQTARAVIHDYKMEIHALLRRLGVPDAEIKLFNPYDRRSVAWDIQEDCTDNDVAGEIAYGFVPPDEKVSDPFFKNGATFVFRDVLRFFMYEAREQPGYRWTLRDVYCAIKSKATLRYMFKKYERLKGSLVFIERPNDDILATLYTNTDKLEAIAALWHGKELFSFHRWRTSGERNIIVLGNDAARQRTIQTLNRILWTRLYKTVLDASLPSQGETWFFLDEFHAMQRLPEIEEFVSTARSFRGNMVIATQDINQIRATYQNDVTNTIMQGLSSKAFFKCTGSAAEWASNQLGHTKRKRRGQGTQLDPQRGLTFSDNEREQPERVFDREYIETLLKASKANGIDGVYVTSLIPDVYRYTMPYQAFKHVWLTPKIEPDYQLEEDKRKYDLPLWTPLERERLGLPQNKDAAIAPAATAAAQMGGAADVEQEDSLATKKKKSARQPFRLRRNQ
jgi:hypothetical protein